MGGFGSDWVKPQEVALVTRPPAPAPRLLSRAGRPLVVPLPGRWLGPGPEVWSPLAKAAQQCSPPAAPR